MANSKAIAETSVDGQVVQVEILTIPSSTGLCKVLCLDGSTIVRHVDRLTPKNVEAENMFANWRRTKGTK